MSLIRRTHSALSLAIALMVFIAPIQRAHAQQSTAETYHFSFEELGFREDRVAAGTAATLFYELPVPHSWQGVSPKINLHFSHSSLLIPDLSQMTVLYNDIPVADVRFGRQMRPRAGAMHSECLPGSWTVTLRAGACAGRDTIIHGLHLRSTGATGSGYDETNDCYKTDVREGPTDVGRE